MNGEILKIIRSNEELYKKLLDAQRLAQSEGWTEEAFALKIKETFQNLGHDISKDDALALITSQSATAELGDSELNKIAGGDCMHSKTCPSTAC